MKKYHIGKSKIHGNGVIASQGIKRGELIACIRGEKRHLLVRNKKESLSYPNWVGISKRIWIDPVESAKFLNHSCNPNAGISGKISLRALRNITKGEEVTIDYSTIEADRLWGMKCVCNHKNCRRMIRSIEFLSAGIFKKYGPNIPTNFKKIYLRRNKYPK